MSNAHEEFMGAMTTLKQLKLHRAHTAIIWIAIILVAATTALLIFTPWVQTAQGFGHVDSPNPAFRIQPISALLTGQIETWHVKEGDSIKKGQPIVTLVDIDSGRLGKLRSQKTTANQRYKSNQLAVQNARSNLSRQKKLFKEGLVSKKQVEQTRITLEKLKAEAAKTQEELDSFKMNLARQETHTKVAPVDGTVVRLRSGGNATYVKAGDMLGWFVPSNINRMVNIKVNGLDAVLVTKGRSVRIQFEGWPAFHFSGWPGISVGTFEGVVSFVEPVADDNGLFTVWIEPAPDAEPWPDDDSTRLGSRAKAWVLLEEVQLGYELWRQLNNFPPVRQDAGGT